MHHRHLAALGAAASAGFGCFSNRRTRGPNARQPLLLCQQPPPQPVARSPASVPGRCAGWDRDWDLRHPRDGDDVQLQGRVRVLLLVRHGQYETRGGPGYGRLTDLGREQARMAGQHIAARMRADPALKRGMLRMTSSAVERAIQTADIMQQEIEAELAWVDVPVKKLLAARARFVRRLDDHHVELALAEGCEAVTLEDAENLLQPSITVRPGARIRLALCRTAAEPSGERPLAELAGSMASVCVHSPLAPVQRLDDRFEGWVCDGCGTGAMANAHWSDVAESTGICFCDACFEKGPKHKKLKEGDSCGRVTQGVQKSSFRAPNDKNLNEADVDVIQGLLPTDALYETYGALNSAILKDHAQVEAAFYTHFHRAVDHKKLRRKDREDVVQLTFAACDGDKKHERRWTAKEFAKLTSSSDGDRVVFDSLLDEDAKKHVEGRVVLQRIGDVDVSAVSEYANLSAEVEQQFKKLAKKRPQKQVEIVVVHQNIIRYLFLRAMQFDTTMWLNFGGGNCTMTQLRINRKGDVICDFFADHGSVLPISHYTFNKQPDV